MPGNYVWSPTPDVIERANVTRFMRRHGIADHRELVARSIADIEWFWGAVIEDLDIAFFRPHDAILDASRGIAWCRWFVGGSVNLAHQCLDRHAPSSASRPRRRDLGGRGRLGAAALLRRAARRDLPPGRGAATAGDRPGRPGRAVPADGARGRRRVPGVRQDRRGRDPDLLRLRRGGRRRPARRRPGRGADHGRRLVPPRQGDRAGARRARGRRRLPERPPRHRRPVERRWRTTAPDARHLDWDDARRERAGRVSLRAARPRDPADDHVHVGHDGAAQGGGPRPRRVPGQDRPGGRPPGRHAAPTTCCTG